MNSSTAMPGDDQRRGVGERDEQPLADRAGALVVGGDRAQGLDQVAGVLAGGEQRDVEAVEPAGLQGAGLAERLAAAQRVAQALRQGALGDRAGQRGAERGQRLLDVHACLQQRGERVAQVGLGQAPAAALALVPGVGQRRQPARRGERRDRLDLRGLQADAAQRGAHGVGGVAGQLAVVQTPGRGLDRAVAEARLRRRQAQVAAPARRGGSGAAVGAAGAGSAMVDDPLDLAGQGALRGHQRCALVGEGAHAGGARRRAQRAHGGAVGDRGAHRLVDRQQLEDAGAALEAAALAGRAGRAAGRLRAAAARRRSCAPGAAPAPSTARRRPGTARRPGRPGASPPTARRWCAGSRTPGARSGSPGSPCARSRRRGSRRP